jgi:hypothetical protein
VSQIWNEISIDRYLPMLRLLQPDDLEFLRNRTALPRRRVTRLRRQRAHLALSFLRYLERDFAQLCGAIRVLIALQPEPIQLAAARKLKRHMNSFRTATLLLRLRLLVLHHGMVSKGGIRVLTEFETVRRFVEELAGGRGCELANPVSLRPN